MALIPKITNNRRVTDTGTGGAALSREELLRRQRALAEAAERKRQAEQAEVARRAAQPQMPNVRPDQRLTPAPVNNAFNAFKSAAARFGSGVGNAVVPRAQPAKPYTPPFQVSAGHISPADAQAYNAPKKREPLDIGGGITQYGAPLNTQIRYMQEQAQNQKRWDNMTGMSYDQLRQRMTTLEQMQRDEQDPERRKVLTRDLEDMREFALYRHPEYTRTAEANLAALRQTYTAQGRGTQQALNRLNDFGRVNEPLSESRTLEVAGNIDRRRADQQRLLSDYEADKARFDSLSVRRDALYAEYDNATAYAIDDGTAKRARQEIANELDSVEASFEEAQARMDEWAGREDELAGARTLVGAYGRAAEFIDTNPLADTSDDLARTRAAAEAQVRQTELAWEQEDLSAYRRMIDDGSFRASAHARLKALESDGAARKWFDQWGARTHIHNDNGAVVYNDSDELPALYTAPSGMLDGATAGGISDTFTRRLKYASGDEVAVYQYLHEIKDPQLNDVGYYFDMMFRDRESEDVDARQIWLADNAPPAAFVVSRLSRLMGQFEPAVDIVNQVVKDISGNKRPTDMNQLYRLNRQTKTIDARIAQNLDEAYGTIDEDVPIFGGKGVGALYDTASSLVDSWLGRKILGHNSAASFIAPAAASRMMEREARDDPWTNIVHGLTSGAIEYLTETALSVEPFFAIAGSNLPIPAGIALQGLAEGAEEGTSDILNLLADNLINGNKSELAQKQREYRNSGEFASIADADKQALKEWWGDVAFSSISGFVSGMAGMGVEQAEQSFSRISQGIQQNRAVGEQVLTNSGEQALGNIIDRLNSALAELNLEVEQISQPADQSPRMIGKKHTQVMSDAERLFGRAAAAEAEQTGTVAQQGPSQRILDALKDMDALTRPKAAEAVETGTERATDTPGTPNAAKLAADERRAGFKVSEDGQATVAGDDGEEQAVTPRAIKGAGTENVTVSVEDADGTVRDVPIADVQFANEFEADKNAYAAGMTNDALANTFRTSITEAQDMATVSAGMEFAYLHGLEVGRYSDMLTGSVLVQGLTDAQVRAAYEIGKSERDAVIKDKQGAAEHRRAKLPKVGEFDYGTVDQTGLTPIQKRQMDIVGQIIKAAGLRGQAYESTAKPDGRFLAPNALVDKDGVIHIDVNAGRNNKGDSMAETAILGAAGHELTHVMQRVNPAAYEAYRQTVLEAMEAAGTNVQAMIDKVFRDDKGVKTRDAAIDEVVSNASWEMLNSSDFVDRLFKARPAQARTIGQRLVDFLAKIKAAIRKAFAGNTQMRAEVRAIIAETDRLSKMWADNMLEGLGVDESGAPQQLHRTLGRDLRQGNRQAAQADVETPAQAAEAPASPERVINAREIVNEDGTVGAFGESAKPESAHIDNRTIDSVSEPDADVFANDYPMVRQYYAAPAQVLLQDLIQSDKAISAPVGGDSRDGWIGVKRNTTPALAWIIDNSGGQWSPVQRVLERYAKIAETGDFESAFPNNKQARVLELELDRMLSEGYTTMDGFEIPADTGYLHYKSGLPGASESYTVPVGAREGSFTEHADGDVQYSARERDAEYLSAVERGDMETAQRMVDEAAKAAGYTNDSPWRVDHRAPNSKSDVSITAAHKMYGEDIYSPNAARYYGDMVPYDNLAISILKKARDNPDLMVTVYRAVPKSVKDSRIRNGDWVSTTIQYATEHGKRQFGRNYRIVISKVPANHLFLDGGSIHEYGYDNGDTDEVYKNVKNNVKLDAVTYSDDGSVIPLSERFNEESEDIRYSTREADTSSPAFRAWFGDSAVVNEDGSPKVMYHGSASQFTQFDKSKARGSGLYGRGFYFTDVESAAAAYGTPYKVYLSVQEPLSPGSSKITRAQARRFLDATAENEDYSIENYGTYDVDKIMRTVYSPDAFKVIQDVNATAIGDMAEAVQLFNKVNGTSYDGIIVPTETVVFEPTQIKSATDNTGTFDPENPDIRYSARDPEAISNREILASAFESVATNAKETNALKGYQKQIVQYDAIQADLDARRAEIKTLNKVKGKSAEQKAELVKLRNQADVLADKLARFDKKLLSFEAAAPLRAVAERERAVLKDFYADKITAAKLAERTKASAKYAQIKARGDERVAKVRARYEGKLTQQKQRTAERVAGIRTQRDRKLAEQKQRTAERIERMRQGRRDTETRRKMRKLIDEFERRLVRPREGFYVPDELRDSIVALGDGDLRASKGHEAQDMLRRILAAYKATEGVAGLENVYDAQVAALVEATAENIAERAKRNGQPLSIHDLTDVELERVYTVLKAIKHAIVTSIKLTSRESAQNAFEIGEAARQEMLESKGKYRSDFMEKAITMNLDAYGMFMRFGNQDERGAAMTMFHLINDGELHKIKLEMDANRIFDDVLDGRANEREIRKLRAYAKDALVDVGLKDAQGVAVPITRGMMLSVYRHLGAEQNLEHIVYGGLTVPELMRYYKGNSEAWGTGARRVAGIGGTVAQLRYQQRHARGAEAKAAIQAQIDAAYESGYAEAARVRQNIEGALTDYERRLLASENIFHNDFARNAMNEATEKRYGYEIATNDNYFPINVDQRFLKGAFDVVTGQPSVAGMGIAQARVEGAKQPLLLRDMTDVLRQQIDSVTLYAAMLNPVNDFTKIYNTTLAGMQESLKETLASTFGKNAETWVKNYLSDAQRGRIQERSIFDKVKSNYAGAVLTANISSALKNFTAYFGAPAVVGWKHSLHALARGGKSKLPISRADVQLIGTYTPLLWDRARGMNSREMAEIKNMVSWGGRAGTGTLDVGKLMGVLDWINRADAAAAGRMWYAAEYYVAEQQPNLNKGTAEQIKAGESPFYQEVAKVYNQMIQRTQQSFTASQLADVLRNPNPVVRGMTMFISQPLKQFGMLYNTAAELRATAAKVKAGTATQEQLGAARRKLANNATSFMALSISEIIAGALASFVLHKKNPLNDDEEEWWEFLLWGMYSNLASTVAYGNYFADITEALMQGRAPWDIEHGSIAPINDFVQKLARVVNGFTKLMGDEYEDEEAYKKAVTKYLTGAVTSAGFSLAKLSGVPAENIYKLTNGIVRNFQDAINGEFGSMNAGADRPSKYYYDKLFAVALDGDEEAFDKLLEEVADTVGKPVPTIRGQVRSRVREQFVAGELDEQTAQTILQGSLASTNKESASDTAEWQYTIDTGRKLGDLKKHYMDGKVTFDEAVAIRIKYGLMKDDTADNEVLHWKYEKDTGAYWSDLEYEYLTGKRSKEDTRAILMEYGEKDKAKANLTINGWAWKADTGADSFAEYTIAKDILRRGGTLAELNAEIANMGADYGKERGDVLKELKSYMRELVRDNVITPEKAISYREKYLGEKIKDNDKWFDIKEYKYIQKNGSADGYKKYGELISAVNSGKNIDAWVVEYMAHGAKKGTISGQLSAAFKERYVVLTETNTDAANALLEKLLVAYTAAGYKRNERTKHIRKYWTRAKLNEKEDDE